MLNWQVPQLNSNVEIFYGIVHCITNYSNLVHYISLGRRVCSFFGVRTVFELFEIYSVHSIMQVDFFPDKIWNEIQIKQLPF
jgi:hypothetical protein